MLTTSRRFPSLVLVSILLWSLLALACSVSVPGATPTSDQPITPPGTLTATFIGQDGGSYAGRLCAAGTAPDNIHIHLAGLRSDEVPVSYRVEDYARGGVWATPCDPVSNWFLYATLVTEGAVDLYFKPFREAPEGTMYRITVTYPGGETEIVEAEGLLVKP